MTGLALSLLASTILGSAVGVDMNEVISTGGGFGSLDSSKSVQEAVVTLEDGVFDVKEMSRDTPFAVVSGLYTDTLFELGWDQLQLDAGSDYYSDKDRMYAMGMLESYFIHDRIYKFWENFDHNDLEGSPAGVKQWFKDQWEYVKIMTQTSNETFWQNMALIEAQAEGYIDGYQKFRSEGEDIDPLDMYILQSWGDLGDVQEGFRAAAKQPAEDLATTPDAGADFEAGPGTLSHGSCTSMIRLMDDGEIAVAHNTWRSYEGFIRVFKRNTYPNGLTVTMSSTPGLIHSKDDFYVQENGNLIAVETTNSMYDQKIAATLATNPDARHVCLSWQRVMSSIVFSSTAPEFVDSFVEQANSGTYNNQWMVVDVNRHHEGATDQVAMIVEQSIGYSHKGDISSVLLDRGYWKSYNIPYFPDVYEQMGYNDSDKQSSYHQCARSEISDRDAPHLANLEDVMSFSRYNEYLTDPISEGCARLSIASRYDLSTQAKCGAGAGPQAFGAIDAKVVTSKDLTTVHAVSGPTSDPENGIPVFQWSTSPVDHMIEHVGMPDRYDFPWVRFNGESWSLKSLDDSACDHADHVRMNPPATTTTTTTTTTTPTSALRGVN
ncbi:hypothetical protein FOZ61_007130 [Perkinsus olseni]|uniref:Phospholipase B-like n=1 Tax=Perkinsus olseni TaxID=32597 RepID=A0A7J6LFH5_PEROL|nr:hypothetical protein FOZ61_007130 [Perkinsus olseni]KAF4657760.1 hypothetical protein FOL46_007283 [Perkinsus olseni]